MLSSSTEPSEAPPAFFPLFGTRSRCSSSFPRLNTRASPFFTGSGENPIVCAPTSPSLPPPLSARKFLGSHEDRAQTEQRQIGQPVASGFPRSLGGGEEGPSRPPPRFRKKKKWIEEMALRKTLAVGGMRGGGGAF